MSVLVVLIIIIWTQRYDRPQMELGVTFSKTYAEALEVDWRLLYLAMLDELDIKKLRLIAYWSEIEKEPGLYDFYDLDWQIERAKEYGVDVILAVGRRLPRWPECHEPAWVKTLPESDTRQRQLAYVRAVIEHYKNNTAITMWQIENEPFLSLFGECPDLDEKLLQQEIDLTRSIDQRPIMITDSGELSLWWRAGKQADVLGSTLYRVVWNKYTGYFHHVFPPIWYYGRALFLKKFYDVDRVIVSELQAEPWIPEGWVKIVPFERQIESVDLRQIQANIDFARRSGFDEVYLWGVEWWYWLAQHEHPEFWQAAKNGFR